ncbi:MAG: DUF3089 domain-containing protein [Propionibacteriaceae bacterium]|nr:DUF3089 domain-containing protein [Propionibacteriaceae bacterium]
MDYSNPNLWFLSPSADRLDDAPDVFVIAPTFVFDADKPVYVDTQDREYLDGNAEFNEIAVAPIFADLAVNVWMPKYRQVNGGHFQTRNDPMTFFWDQQPQPVLQDIFAAFTHFLCNRTSAPFIIFSHSQGSILNGFLLGYYLPGCQAATQRSLGVDFLIGWGLNDTILSQTSYSASTSPTDTGTIVSWNTATKSEVAGSYRQTWGDASTRAVNPITFDTRTEYVPPQPNQRSLLRHYDESELRTHHGLTGARLVTPSQEGGIFAGVVVEVDIDEHEFRSDDTIASQDAAGLGYTHHWDISLFVDSIRMNLMSRLGISELRS